MITKHSNYLEQVISPSGDVYLCDNYVCDLHKSKYFVELEKRIDAFFKSGKSKGISRSDDFVE